MVAAVDLFYKKVLADPLLAPYFSSMSMDALLNKQVAFMTWAFGGPSEYKGRDLRIAHAPLVKNGLSEAHFDAVAQHLKTTLTELGVSSDLIGEALAIVATTKADVLGR